MTFLSYSENSDTKTVPALGPLIVGNTQRLGQWFLGMAKCRYNDQAYVVPKGDRAHR